MSKRKKSRRQVILDTVDDLVAAFMYYDRKEDEDLSSGEIEAAIAAGEITVREIVERFQRGLESNVNA